MNALSLVEKIACLSDADKEWLERFLDRLLATPARRKGCDCHVIDPKKQDIIIWLGNKDDLVVKIANQRFIGMPRVDKRGQKYWKVREFYEDEESESASLVNSKLSLKEEVEALFKKPMSEQTVEDRKKWAEWTKIQAHEQKIQASASSSQIKSLLENLKEKKAQEALNPQVEINEPVNP